MASEWQDDSYYRSVRDAYLLASKQLRDMVSVDEDGLFEGPLARFLTIDGNDQAREIHEKWFWVIVALIALHVAAIIYYRLRGKKLTKAMITGKARLGPGVAPMRPGKWWAALLCFAAGIAFTRWLLAGAPPFGG